MLGETYSNRFVIEPAERESRRAPTGKTSTPTFWLGFACCLLFLWVVDVFRARCSSVFQKCVSVFVPVLESILGTSWVVFGAFGCRFWDLGQGSSEDALSGAFWSPLGGQLGFNLGPKLEPSCDQNHLRSWSIF